MSHLIDCYKNGMGPVQSLHDVRCYDHVIGALPAKMATSVSVPAGAEEQARPHSPELDPSTLNSIEGSEQSGVPLNTTWTFWIDRYSMLWKAISYTIS